MKLEKTRLAGGLWEGLLTGATEDPPRLRVTHRDRVLEDVTCDPVENQPGVWRVGFRIPASALGDGVQSILINGGEPDEALASIAVLAGEAIDEDIRAEVSLLRAEPDLLKRALRRHLSDT